MTEEIEQLLKNLRLRKMAEMIEGELAAAYNALREVRGHLRIFAANRRVLGTLQKVHLDGVFDLCEDENSALVGF